MILFIYGPTHAGKTLLARRLARKTGALALSLDLLKMGLIRSGMLPCTPLEDERIEQLMWPAVRELVQTALENDEDLIVEGDYLPSEWRADFQPGDAVDAVALVFSERYVKHEFEAILAHAEAARRRLVAGEEHVTRDELRVAHAAARRRAERAGDNVLLVDANYEATLEAWLAAARERFPCRPGLGQL